MARRLVTLPGPSSVAWRLIIVDVARTLPRRGAAAAGGVATIAKGELTPEDAGGPPAVAVGAMDVVIIVVALGQHPRRPPSSPKTLT
jgi:hypothetical protein